MWIAVGVLQFKTQLNISSAIILNQIKNKEQPKSNDTDQSEQ